MVDSSLISKVLESQLLIVFKTYDRDGSGVLSMKDFQTFLYAVGMQFLSQDYQQEVAEKFGSGASFPDFLAFLNEKSRFEYSAKDYE